MTLEDADTKIAVVFDLDGTVTDTDTFRLFLLRLLLSRPDRALRFPQLVYAATQFVAGLRDNGWLKERYLRTLAGGMTKPELTGFSNRFVRVLRVRHILTGALQAIESHRTEGCHLVLATASPDVYARELGDRLRFDSVISTETAWNELDIFEGRLIGGNCYGERKQSLVAEYFGACRDDWHITAYSDHHSDIPLLKWADRGIAVNPTKQLRESAENLGFSTVRW